MKDYEFRWIEWNLAKCEKHGVDPDDAEYVVRNADTPFPMKADDEKIVVWGQQAGGRYLQVIYLVDPDETLFVIHAMPLTERQKHQLRRRQP
jgi:uncharacterized DUF497 family protein